MNAQTEIIKDLPWEGYKGISWVNHNHPKGINFDIDETYCYRCGAKLIPSRLPKIIHYKRGEPVYRMVLICPNKKWYNLHAVSIFNTEWGYWQYDSPPE